jgi:predicted outer membrane repeat protein
VIHVKPTGQDSNTGASWSAAKQTIQAAIESANVTPDKCDVWVAAGTYVPTYQTDPFAEARTATLLLRAGVNVFGGFAGDEVELSERDIAASPTILSGELGASGRDGNLFHVVTTESISDTAQFRLDGFTIRDGYAPSALAPKPYGGGAYCVRGRLVLENDTFVTNSALRGGAVAAEATCNLEVSDSLFENNLAVHHVNNFEAAGGAIAKFGGTLAVTDSTFRANRAYETKDRGIGGAIYTDGQATVTRSQFEDNDAAVNGGAIRVAGVDVHVDDCDFDENFSGSGGAIYAHQKTPGGNVGTLFVNNSRFTGNWAASTPTPQGGAILTAAQVLRVTGSTFHQNDAFTGGGAVYSGNVTTIDDSLFTENTSADGAAVAGVFDVTIRTSSFLNNGPSTSSASSNGAVRMRSGNGTLKVTDSSFISNVKGRAITYNCTATSAGCRLFVDGATFIGNASQAKGGAISLDTTNTSCAPILASIVNSVFIANQAGSDGGAIANQTCATVSLVHDTFFGNQSGARGGAIYAQSMQLNIANSILWGNSAVSQGPQAFNETGVTLSLTYSNVQGIAGGTNGNISADPLFQSTTAGAVDLHLQDGSPCIDAGSAAALATDATDRDADTYVGEPTPYDLDKAARVLGAATDMGAYER